MIFAFLLQLLLTAPDCVWFRRRFRRQLLPAGRAPIGAPGGAVGERGPGEQIWEKQFSFARQIVADWQDRAADQAEEARRLQAKRAARGEAWRLAWAVAWLIAGAVAWWVVVGPFFKS